MEIECLELLVNGIRGADVSNVAVDLQAVVVHDQHQVVQFSGACEHGSLPYLALLDLTVAQQGISAVILAGHFGRQRHTHCGRHALAQRTAGHIHARNVLSVRMALEIRAYFPKGFQILHREKASVCQRRIVARRRVPLGQDKTVSALFFRSLRVNIHFLKIQIGENIRCGQGAARMP